MRERMLFAMCEHPIRTLIEISAAAIEVLAVMVIVTAITFGTARFLFHLHGQVGDAYERYKVHLGKSLLLGLEYLVAADIIRTVALEPTMTNAVILGLLVVVRTFLSWSLVVEIEGRWPWASGNEVEAVSNVDTDPGRHQHGARRGQPGSAAPRPQEGAV